MVGMSAPTPFTTSYGASFVDRAIGDMRAGIISAVTFATVADNLILAFGENGLHASRAYAANEAFDDYCRQLNVLRNAAAENNLKLGTKAVDINAAHQSGEPVGLISIEGGDFIEDRLERVEHAKQAGVRSITLIHYNVNQIGDTQTCAPVHGGLTALGREIVKAMDVSGVIVDLAHATYETVRDVAEISTRPMVISHSNLRYAEYDHPRLIGLDHARLVTQGGGVIGAVAAGFGQSSFQEYIESILRMIDVLGIDHVAIGTDLDFTYKPVFTSYRDWAAIPAALLARGLHPLEAAKVMGGNYLRVLRAAEESFVPSGTSS